VTFVAALSEVPDPGAVVRDIDHAGARLSVLITRRDGAVALFENRCPHAGWPLERADGRVLFTPDGALLCVGHGAQFAMMTGACLAGPGTGRPLKRLACAVRDDAIWLSDS
jgi:nitrite reductase/ring-hydroxylating ferredoxin subunit